MPDRIWVGLVPRLVGIVLMTIDRSHVCRGQQFRQACALGWPSFNGNGIGRMTVAPAHCHRRLYLNVLVTRCPLFGARIYFTFVRMWAWTMTLRYFESSELEDDLARRSRHNKKVSFKGLSNSLNVSVPVLAPHFVPFLYYYSHTITRNKTWKGNRTQNMI